MADAVRSKAWPDFWAASLKLAVDGHPFDLRGREYEQAILRDESKSIIGPKGAQLGFTSCFIIKCAHAVVKRGWHVLYLLPLKAGSVQFVQGRIDPIIDSNKGLAGEFSRTDNRSQKQTRNGVNWYIRGTNIETELREVPADILVLDERDKANEDNLDDARARLSGSHVQRVYEISTPTVDGHGVYADDAWGASDQMQWWPACPHCSARQVITFDENVLPFLGDKIEDCHEACRCSHCHKPWTDADRANMNATGVWVPANPGAVQRGYHLNQFNSPTATLTDPKLGILVNYFKGQLDSKKLKAFHNLALGLPYAAAGDKFSPELLDRCRRDYLLGGPFSGQLFIGIDVGHDVLYVTIWNRDPHEPKKLRLWRVQIITGRGPRTKWQVLDEEVLGALGNWLAVCDAHPDKEQCEALSKKYGERFWMGFEKDRPEQHETANFIKPTYGEPTKVNIDRTMAFDSYIKQFLDGNMELPAEAREMGEFLPRLSYNAWYQHHFAMVRVEQPDAQEREVARWVNTKGSGGKKPDHWHHSGMFGLMASFRETPLTIPEDVGAVLAAAGGLIATSVPVRGEWDA
jgi:Phage terminase large subunit gpA, ATPase domain/Terminase large subunit gpA, endonuclease domain